MDNKSTHSFCSDESRWQAVVDKDRLADGVFYFAVKTTGVYCRPVCTARLPRKHNVEFFDTSQDAERAGYRACKKCRPDLPADNLIPDQVIAACRLIERAEEPPSLDELADAVGLSSSYFHRLFKKTIGITPKAYAAAQRMERFRKGLRRNESITSAMYEAGYRASSRCYENAGKTLGMTPGQYKNGGAGQEIEYVVTTCSLGWIAVAATEKGVCFIALGDTQKELRDELSRQFNFARLKKGSPMLVKHVETIIEYINSPEGALSLPLDVQGTAFQRKVWQELQKVPAGRTATYSDIARRIGRPRAARAVGSACAGNRLAIAVPCHRIVREDGGLVGYRWGLERMRKLLDHEASGDSEAAPSPSPPANNRCLQ